MAHFLSREIQLPFKYSKDTQQLTGSDQRQPGRHAAQPCSYIYPLYSVVKKRRAICIAASSLVTPLGGLSNRAQGSDSDEPGLNLKQAAYELLESGGAERDRTVDPLLAKQVLSQLSYSPIATKVYQVAGISGGPG